MAVGTPRRDRRAGARRRRASSGDTTVTPPPACSVGGCSDAGRALCRRCGRAVCLRHGGLTRAAAGSSATTARCALCRLDDRRRGQSTVRRLWWAISAAGFAVFAVLAIRSNARQGVALVLLAAVILVVAFFYDRLLRRS